MIRDIEKLLRTIREIATEGGPRKAGAKKMAGAIRAAGNYRWVGVYDVSAEWVSILAFSGPGAPAYPKFEVGKGLTGAAIAKKQRSSPGMWPAIPGT
jgi:putative methionine-R-sulfoxide reductase with GAF domain